jgi:hypothetical protein
MPRVLCAVLLVSLALANHAHAASPQFPIIHSTDLCHPYDDPDDHYDLACLFAMQEFDIRGIVLDLGEHQAPRPGRPAVEQMFHITKRNVPNAVGLDKRLRSLDDKAIDERETFQGGVQLILSLLRASNERVVIHTAGSCRDVAAAFNREPELFRKKVKAIYVEAGNGPDGKQDEYNVMLCPLAYLRLLESGLPVYWCPCFGKQGYQTYYQVDQTQVVAACTQPVQNYFVYCLSKSKEDPLAFITAGPKTLPSGSRNMWCTAPMLHAAGRKIYQRAADDFVALTPGEAEKAGLKGRPIEVFQFVPVQISLETLPAAGSEEKGPAPLMFKVQLDHPHATTFLFHATDPRYERILASCLKNLLTELGR